MKPETWIDCDVLVVGGGAAGLTAAIEARAAGASVLVACKGRAGRSGNTVVAASQFSAVIPYEGSEDSPERHFRDSLKGGCEINDEPLLRLLTERAGGELLKAESRGVRLLRSGGELVRRLAGGHSYPRGIPANVGSLPTATSGLAITLPLRAWAERTGVQFLDGAPVLRLISDDRGVVGALAADLQRNELVGISANAVVVAAGGAGRIFANTNNTGGICGDSYGLMLQAGARLRDMEFVQFYPAQMTRPFAMLISSSFFGDGAVLRNRAGERFMPLYDPKNADLATRDVMCQAMFREIQKGHDVGGELYMDCTAVSEEMLQKKYPSIVQNLRKLGVELRKDWLRVAPTTHFMMGGVLIKEDCSTGVPGLFAAGEATGGVHGANRLGGNALSETLVFGTIAGQSAARSAGSVLRREATTVVYPTSGSGASNGAMDEVRAELRSAMWKGASIVRSQASLEAALSTVRASATEVDRSAVPTAAEAARIEETRQMCLTAEAVVLAALARMESRGAHCRDDAPRQSDDWQGSNFVRLAAGTMQIEFVPNR